MDYFELWNEPSPVYATHDHWVKWGKLIRVWLGDNTPLNVTVCGDFPRGLKKYDDLEIELRLLFYEGDFYKDEDEYYAEEGHTMASESIIPCGTFSPTQDPNFKQTPTVLLRGKVLSVEEFEEYGDRMFKIELKMWDYVFRVIAIDGFGELGVHPGNILSGFFFVDGKVNRRG